jgi:hypothetical protein
MHGLERTELNAIVGGVKQRLVFNGEVNPAELGDAIRKVDPGAPKKNVVPLEKQQQG